VVELVDNDDVEVSWFEIREPGSVQTLNRREDVFEPTRALAAEPQFPKRVVAKAMPKHCEALLENLFPMSNEEQARARENVA